MKVNMYTAKPPLAGTVEAEEEMRTNAGPTNKAVKKETVQTVQT